MTGMTTPSAMAITPDGTTLWVADSAGKAWPINNLKTTPTLGTPVTGMTSPHDIAIAPDGNTAWIADNGGSRAWPINNLKTAPTLGTAVTGTGGLYAIAIMPDGNTAWVTDSAGKAWPITNLKGSPVLGTAITGMTNPIRILITPDGTTAWVVDNAAKVWPITNLKGSPALGSPVTGISSPQAIALAQPVSYTALPDTIASGMIYRTYTSSITANWAPTTTGTGYMLQASTASDFSSISASSFTSNIALSTLTVQGLGGNTTYYLRVSGLSASGYNWLVLGSTTTPFVPVYYWIAGNASNWSNAANWAFASGGYGNVGVPGLGAQAIFDQNGLGNCTIDETVIVGTLTVTSLYNGTLDTSSNTIVMSSFTLNNGTFYARSSAISVSAGWSINGGQFLANASMVTLAASAGSTVTLVGNTSFYSLADTTPGNWIVMPANSTTTVLNAMILTGAAGNMINLRSSANGTYAYLLNAGTNTVTYVNAQDNNASSTTIVDLAGFDNSHNINWTFPSIAVAPTNLQISAVAVSSISVVWSSATPSGGYEVDAATSSDFGGTILSTMTPNGSATTLIVDSMTSLSPDTTYFIRIGNTYAGTTTYSLTILSTSTLTGPITNAQLYQTFSTSMTVNWTPLGAAQGYILQASSTNFNGTGTIYFSSNTSVSASTLTVTGLTANIAYTLRVGGINWNGVANYATLSGIPTYTAWLTDTAGNVWPVRNLLNTPTLGTPVTGLGSAYRIANTPDGNTAWVTTKGGSVYPVNNLLTTPVLGTPVTGMIDSLAIAITPDGNTAWVVDDEFSGGITGEAWPITTLKTSPTLGAPVTGLQSPASIAITPNGTMALVGDDKNGDSTIWPITSLQSAPALGTPITGAANLSPVGIAITPDGTTAWVSDPTGFYPVNNLNGSPSLGTKVAGVSASRGVAITPDGNTAWGLLDGAVTQVNNIAISPIKGVVISGIAGPRGIAITPDGNTAWVADGGTAWPIINLKATPALGTPVNGTGSSQGIAIASSTVVPATLSPAPNGGQIYTVMMTSITANWAVSGAVSGYQLDASTDVAFGGTLFSSVTTSVALSTLTVTGLTTNTTYYLRIGDLNVNGVATYASLASTSTLTNRISPHLYTVAYSSITVNWPALPATPSSATAEGYELDASTNSNFVPLWTSSITSNVSLSTLTLTSLNPATTYYLRVGALNWDGVANDVALSTGTLSVGCSTITSIINGLWSSPSTWSPPAVPTSCNPVYVISGTTVTVDISSAMASTMTITGQLSFSRVANSTLTIVGGNMYVNSGGTLDMGYVTNPIKASSATWVLPYNVNAGQYFMTVQNGGNFVSYGSNKIPWTLATSMSILPVDSRSTWPRRLFSMAWQVGDRITASARQKEAATIRRKVEPLRPISGFQITVNGSAFGNIHTSTAGIRVDNLTRNVVVTSTATSAGGAKLHQCSDEKCDQLQSHQYGAGVSWPRGSSFPHEHLFQCRGNDGHDVSSCTIRAADITAST